MFQPQYAVDVRNETNYWLPYSTGTIHWHRKLHRPGEIYWLNSNHNLLTKLTGWSPKVTLSDGLDRTIEI